MDLNAGRYPAVDYSGRPSGARVELSSGCSIRASRVYEHIILYPSTSTEEVGVISEILATFACGIFAGAALYVNLVEQPARLSCGVGAAINHWRPGYQRGTAMQASLAV